LEYGAVAHILNIVMNFVVSIKGGKFLNPLKDCPLLKNISGVRNETDTDE
jgi:hypothetical protein